MQANVTDNTPVFILGGNILPVAAGGMTTTEAKSSNLTLIVAFAGAASTEAMQRCNTYCPVQKVGCLWLQQHDDGHCFEMAKS